MALVLCAGNLEIYSKQFQYRDSSSFPSSSPTTLALLFCPPLVFGPDFFLLLALLEDLFRPLDLTPRPLLGKLHSLGSLLHGGMALGQAGVTAPCQQQICVLNYYVLNLYHQSFHCCHELEEANAANVIMAPKILSNGDLRFPPSVCSPSEPCC